MLPAILVLAKGEAPGEKGPVAPARSKVAELDEAATGPFSARRRD
jgi:hypothetical protein